ncbi:unnamed protein product [Camellia sinensis]|uniref:MLO-like protein 13 n=1 Tax=Camellia sinensis TaxID=4442 RepID=UPI001035B906|nr:MLO-like protein 13 [Camellia sinensis]
MAAESSRSLVYTPTWIVAGVCTAIVLISLLAERALHRLGKYLKHKEQDALFEALQKIKEELMLLGFISLLLTVSQGPISRICIPAHLASYMLPCKLETAASSSSGNNHEQYFQQTMTNGRRLLFTETGYSQCTRKGKVPLLSLEALHQLHIFIFVLAVVHVIFCATTMILGGAKIRQWKRWEDSIRSEISMPRSVHSHARHHQIFKHRADGYWRRSVVISGMLSCFKQFYGSVTKSDYVALRLGFIRTHCPSHQTFDFHKYMLRTLQVDFKRIVGISWYLWLFVVIFLLINIQGWHSYFWLSFLPLILLLLVGTKLEYIISRLAEDSVEKRADGLEAQLVKPSDEHFWFGNPHLVLYLIHFILFQNSFEIAFFFWILSTYGFHSCVMEKVGFIIPRLIIGVMVQVLCSYSTLPLYALVTQMGSMFKRGMFEDHMEDILKNWSRRMVKESIEDDYISEEIRAVDEGITTSIIELSHPTRTQISSP